MLKNGTLCQNPGANHFDLRAKGTQIKRLVHRLQSLGYNVEINPIAA